VLGREQEQGQRKNERYMRDQDRHTEQSERDREDRQNHKLSIGERKAAGVTSRIFTLAAWSNRAQDLTSGAQGPCWLVGHRLAPGWGARPRCPTPAGLRGGGPD
jgi:hypothetical protein